MKVKKLFSVRATNSYAFLLCVILISYSAYLQFHVGLTPCPLCVIQRFVMTLLAIVFLVGLLADRTLWIRLHALLVIIVASAGGVIAQHQVKLQQLPKELVPSCGPGLDYMLKNLPLNQTLELLLRGSGDCAEVQTVILGLSLPKWSLVFFAAFVILGVVNLIRGKGRRY